jgi:hypothetical protein
VNGKVVGVIGVDMTLESPGPIMVKDIKPYENGYAFMMAK